MLPRLMALPLAVLFALPAAARAETITIVSGTAEFNPLAGPGPSMYASLETDAFPLEFIWRDAMAMCAISFCISGQTVALGSRLFSDIVNTPPAENQAFGPFVAYTGELVFAGPSIVLPPITGLPPVGVEFSGPFTLTGSLSRYLVVAGLRDPQLLFTGDVFGMGDGDRDVLFGLESAYRLVRLEYVFAAVPEPATLLLVGSELVAGAARRLRRRACVANQPSVT